MSVTSFGMTEIAKDGVSLAYSLTLSIFFALLSNGVVMLLVLWLRLQERKEEMCQAPNLA